MSEATSPIERFFMWRGKDGDVQPTRVECPDGLYPNKDVEGFSIYENTHFKTKEEAWENIEAGIMAGLSLAGDAVKKAEAELARANIEAGKAAKDYSEFCRLKRADN